MNRPQDIGVTGANWIPQYVIYALLLSITGLPFYFFAVYFIFNLRKIFSNTILFIAFYLLKIGSPLLLIAGFIFMPDFRYSFEQFIFYLFAPLFLSFLLIFPVVLKVLKNPAFNRKHSIRYHKPFSLMSRLGELDSFMANVIPDDEYSESLPGRYLMKQMRASSYLGIKQKLIGLLYYIVQFAYYMNGQAIGSKVLLIPFIIIITLIQLLTGYRSEGINLPLYVYTMLTSIPVLILCIGSTFYFRPYDYNILLPVGRDNHFKTNYLAWLIRPILLVGWIIFTILLSWALKSYMPDLSFYGYELNYNPLGFFQILLPLVIIPAYDMFADITKLKSFIFSLFVAGIITGGFAGFLGAHLFFTFNNNNPVNDTEFSLTRITLIIIIISNAAFIFMLKRRWLRSDIV